MAERFWDHIALQPQALNPRLRSTIRRSFVAYAGLILVLGWAYALWYISEDYERTVEFAGEQLRAVADSLNAQMEAMLGDGMGSAQSAMNGLAKEADIAEIPSEIVSAQLREEVTGNYIRALFVGNPKRTIVGGRGVVENTSGVPHWLTVVPRSSETIVAAPMIRSIRLGPQRHTARARRHE